MKLEGFIAGLDKFKGEVTELSKHIHKAVVLECHTRVSRRTPIDTGRARGGWIANPSYPVGHVYNNVEYIVPLENGHSQQAPDGMAEVTVAEMNLELDGMINTKLVSKTVKK